MKSLALSCLLLSPVAAIPEQDLRFTRLASDFLTHYLQLNPEAATTLGEHRWDGSWTDYSPTGEDKVREFLQSTLAELERVPRSTLSPENQVDYDILRHSLQGQLWSLAELREAEWNPLVYNPGPALYALLARDFAPLPQRLDSLTERLEALPSLLKQAESRLKNPARLHTETAISQNAGTISLLRDDLNTFLAPSGPPSERLQKARANAIEALEAYGKWLASDLLPRSTGDFRLGPELYERKLYFTLESPLQAPEIAARAERELRATQREMAQVARPLFRELFGAEAPSDDATVCRKVLDRLADEHPDNRTILEDAREALERTTDFVRAEQIVSLPAEKCEVIEMPEFNRGVAVAYCDSPGALERAGTTFYAIAPAPSDWPARRVESLYREYNDAMLQDLTIHEAMPGHFLQLMHANRFKGSTPLRAVLQSGTFVEGWATYAEQVMAAHGYGGPRVHMQQLKMRLRLILNALLDQRVHAGNLQKEEAIAWLMREGFQEEGEATGKWQRACLTSAQLSTYFVGNTEVNDLARAYKQRFPASSEQEMHDRMLAYGSPAPQYLWRLLGLK